MATEGQQAVPSDSSVPQSATRSSSLTDSRAQRVIPPSQLVILRESELDCDLPTAIQRVREDAGTASSRILIVGPEEGPVAIADRLPLPQLPMSIGQVARSGGDQALRTAGDRLTPKIVTLDYLLGEARRAVSDLEQALAADQKDALRRTRVVRDVLDWVTATTADLQSEVDGLARGYRPVDVIELLMEVKGQAESFFPGIRVNVAPAAADCHCWGRAATLTEALFLGLVITAHRIGGEGAVNVEAEPVPDADGGRVAIRIIGLGEPAEVHASQQLNRFKEIIGQHRGRVAPDAMGPFGTGMVLELPCQPEGEPLEPRRFGGRSGP